MTTKKLLQTGAALTITSLTLAACGAGSESPSNSAATAACDFENPSSPTTVNVLAYNSSAIDPYTNSMVNSCSKDNVTVKHEPIDFAGQVQRTQATLGTDNGTYDLIESYGFVIPGYADQDKLEPLDDLYAEFTDQYDLDGISQDLRDRLSYDGHL
jgi:multiple sugar transport system substrate-binding protein